MHRVDGDHECVVDDSSSLQQQPLTQGGRSALADPPTATARYQVLHTHELLEAILAGCGDMRAVLLAQRVCAFWRDVIRSSSLLQCMLYFEAIPPFGPDEGLSPEELRASFTINPLLCHYFPHWLQYHRRKHSRQPPESCISDQGVITLAPQPICDGDNQNGGGSEASLDEVCADSANLATPARPLFPPERRDAFTRAGASWRRMLVCQPASRGLAFWQKNVHGPYGYGGGFSGCTAPQSEDNEHSSRGLRMGALYDFTLQLHARGLAQFPEGEERIKRERGCPFYFRLYWVPPGYAGLWPFHEAHQRYVSIAPGLGTSIFVVLTEGSLHRMGWQQPPFLPVVAPRCEEHLDDSVLLK
ncbi:F-box domain-containing protein [Apiospora arundinis]|uniref:F-box domain-containing protein n=1 Tax=Apiospora arundinis TaxID=335852 RepID=A0ABR2I3N1_9PEZI